LLGAVAGSLPMRPFVRQHVRSVSMPFPLKNRAKKKDEPRGGRPRPASYNSKLPSYMSNKIVVIIAQHRSKTKPTREGRTLRPFHFDSLGSLCVVGHQTACAELSVPFARAKCIRFSGLLSWAMWRGIYLAKLPGLERKIRVLMDWAVELLFSRDIVQTIDLK